MTTNIRQFLKLTALVSTVFAFNKSKASQLIESTAKKQIKPIVISTWRFGVEANAEAWTILSKNGRALEYASKELQNDKDIVLAAVKN